MSLDYEFVGFPVREDGSVSIHDKGVTYDFPDKEAAYIFTINRLVRKVIELEKK